MWWIRILYGGLKPAPEIPDGYRDIDWFLRTKVTTPKRLLILMYRTRYTQYFYFPTEILRRIISKLLTYKGSVGMGTLRKRKSDWDKCPVMKWFSILYGFLLPPTIGLLQVALDYQKRYSNEHYYKYTHKH